MCILFLQFNTTPSPNGYRLILLSNRDEFYNRPTLPGSPWQENQNIIGGRDMQPGREGGTWFALETSHHRLRFGALLNIPGGTFHSDCPGRGYFVGDYLQSSMNGADYLQTVLSSGITYNTFNLVTAELSEDLGKLNYYSNVDDAVDNELVSECTTDATTNKLLFAIGNSPVTMPLAKVNAGRDRFREIIQKDISKTELINELIDFSKWKKSHWPDAELVKRAPSWAPQLSSIFVEMPKESYGTRTHTIVLVDYQWRLDYIDISLQVQDYDSKSVWDKTHIERQL